MFTAQHTAEADRFRRELQVAHDRIVELEEEKVALENKAETWRKVGAYWQAKYQGRDARL